MTNITITELINPYVKFSSPLGNGMASWSGEVPVVGCNYNVEIDIDEELELGGNLIHSSETMSSVNVVDGKVIFVVKVISYEDDGVLTVSLGSNVIFLEILLQSVIAGFIKLFISPDKVFLYPVEL